MCISLLFTTVQYFFSMKETLSSENGDIGSTGHNIGEQFQLLSDSLGLHLKLGRIQFHSVLQKTRFNLKFACLKFYKSDRSRSSSRVTTVIKHKLIFDLMLPQKCCVRIPYLSRPNISLKLT